MENLPKLNPAKIPAHIAIIMDGNGRWAQKKHLPRITGHREGAKSVETVIKTSVELGVKILTLFVFSTENWLRPKREINFLMRLFACMLKEKYKLLADNGINLRICGFKEKVPPKLLETIDYYTTILGRNRKMILNLAFNYGSKQEIINATNEILKSGKKTITRKNFENYLLTKGLSEPDLIIRTSGEKRLSNFMLWQSAYSELYFTEVLWPDFEKRHLYEAIADYQKRKRRFGGLD